MRLRTSTIQRRHLIPRCLACGQEQLAHRPNCPGCGTDLEERPARSYAELEGLVEFDAPAHPVDPFMAWRRQVTLERWLLTAFTGAVLTAFLLHAVVSMWA